MNVANELIKRIEENWRSTIISNLFDSIFEFGS